MLRKSLIISVKKKEEKEGIVVILLSFLYDCGISSSHVFIDLFSLQGAFFNTAADDLKMCELCFIIHKLHNTDERLSWPSRAAQSSSSPASCSFPSRSLLEPRQPQ